MTVGLVSCGSRKRSLPSKGRDLYLGPLFRLTVLLFEQKGIPWRILSAKYGVVGPDQEVHPYDLTLRDLSKSERGIWARRCRRDLDEEFPKARFLVSAGKEYLRALDGLEWDDVFRDLPVKSIGYRLQALRSMTREGSWSTK